jgi:hypothetical protein
MFEDGHRKLGLAAPLSGIIGGCTTRCAGDPSEASAEFTEEPAGSMTGAFGGMPEAVYEGLSQASVSSSSQPSAPTESHGQLALLGPEPGAAASLFEPELFTWANESWTVTDPGAVDTADPDRDADTAEIMGCVTAMADGLDESVRIPSQRIRFGPDSGRAPAEHLFPTEVEEPSTPLVAAASAEQTATPAEQMVPAQQVAPTTIAAQQGEQAEPFIPASQMTDPTVWGGPIVFRNRDTEGPATQPQPFSALVDEPRWSPAKAWQALVARLRSLRKPGDPSLLNKSVWLSFPPAPAWLGRIKQHILQPVRRTGRRWEPSARSVPLLAALVVLAAVSSLAVVQATSRELRSSAVEMASIGQVGADVLPGFAAPKVVKVPAPAHAAAPAPSAPAPRATPTDATHRAAPAGPPARSSAAPVSASPSAATTPKTKLSAPSRSHPTATHSSRGTTAHSVTARDDAREHRSSGSHHHSSSRSDSDDRDDYSDDYSDDSDDGGLLSGLLGGGALGGLGGGGLGLG